MDRADEILEVFIVENAQIKKLVYDLTSFICKIVPNMTTIIHSKYEEFVATKEAMEYTVATYNNKAVSESTTQVAEALAGEQSMNAKFMKDFIAKEIRNELKKHSKNSFGNGKEAPSNAKNPKPTQSPNQKRNAGKHQRNKKRRREGADIDEAPASKRKRAQSERPTKNPPSQKKKTKSPFKRSLKWSRKDSSSQKRSDSQDE